MYVFRNIEAHSSNNCRSGKAGSIAYSECVSVGIQQAMRTRHIVICGLSGSKKIFFYSISQTEGFSGKKWT
jgi:hypothetical protein